MAPSKISYSSRFLDTLKLVQEASTYQLSPQEMVALTHQALTPKSVQFAAASVFIALSWGSFYLALTLPEKLHIAGAVVLSILYLLMAHDTMSIARMARLFRQDAPTPPPRATSATNMAPTSSENSSSTSSEAPSIAQGADPLNPPVPLPKAEESAP